MLSFSQFFLPKSQIFLFTLQRLRVIIIHNKKGERQNELTQQKSGA